ncbi:polyadenylate-binding protein 2-like [Humulus lupulus]|uniref:polyadenylate-binding protein 2-like n=1 Tax=Humulus lupulus TaxID=3486 RepID=UPI002B4147BA|nr:polyadenylate-binding protein 2-like [Humulus lupulus]
MAQVQVQPQNAAPGANADAANGGNNQFVTTSLYFGDLDQSVTNPRLYDLFNQMGQVVSVRVCRDLTSRRSLGYGCVNYSNPQDAARALEMLNFSLLNGRPIRVMYSHRDPSIHKSGAGNIFIKARYKVQPDPTVDEVKKLCNTCHRYAKFKRVLFHYNGHGVPKPTSSGEIWVFNKVFYFFETLLCGLI